MSTVALNPNNYEKIDHYLENQRQAYYSKKDRCVRINDLADVILKGLGILSLTYLASPIVPLFLTVALIILINIPLSTIGLQLNSAIFGMAPTRKMAGFIYNSQRFYTFFKINMLALLVLLPVLIISGSYIKDYKAKIAHFENLKRDLQKIKDNESFSEEGLKELQSIEATLPKEIL